MPRLQMAQHPEWLRPNDVIYSLLKLCSAMELMSKRLVREGGQPLWLLRQGGHTQITQLFLEKGASTKQVIKNGWTALKVALKLERHAVVRQLKQVGVKQ